RRRPTRWDSAASRGASTVANPRNRARPRLALRMHRPSHKSFTTRRGREGYMKRLALTQHTMRCPLYDCSARLTVCTDSNGYPSRRHLDVAACSLRPSTSFVPPARTAYFPGGEPPVPYTYEISRTPCHSTKVECPKRCLPVLNAAESGAAEPVRCT